MKIRGSKFLMVYYYINPSLNLAQTLLTGIIAPLQNIHSPSLILGIFGFKKNKKNLIDFLILGSLTEILKQSLLTFFPHVL